MKSDFVDALLKELNTGFETMSSRINEVLEVSKVKNQLDDLAKERNNKLAELGSLTFRKITEKEVISDDDINKIIEEIKVINEKITVKKEELDRKIAENSAKSESCCNKPGSQEQTKTCNCCQVKVEEEDKFCKNCGAVLNS